MKVDYALFDMDGTLLDSMYVWRELDRTFLLSHGVREIPPDLGRRTAALTLSQSAALFAREFGLSLTPQQVAAEFQAIIARLYREEVQPKPCVQEYLAYLKKQGARLCIVTATDYPIAEPALRRTGLLPYFDFVLTCEDAGLSKAEPAIFHLAARRLGCRPGQAVVFEDALHCIRAAKAGGYSVVAVEDASAAPDRCQIRLLCDRYITSYTELLPGASNSTEGGSHL